jgi:hypothetical protein
MNKHILVQKLALIKRLCDEIGNELGQDLNDMVVTKNLQDINENFNKLKDMLFSSAWPKAVPNELMCDESSEKDKMDRANGILSVFVTELVEGKNVLDFGTGEGHLPYAAHKAGARVSVGYDMAADFKLKSADTLLYTNMWHEVVANGPYDVIVLFDVIDHLEYETPVNVFLNLKTILKRNGKIYVRYHPFISKHGSHMYKKINKAFPHLVFTDTEMQLIMPDHVPMSNITVLHPIKTYEEYANNSGFKVVQEKITRTKIDDFFKNDLVSKRICELTGSQVLPESQMEIEFVDHVLSVI